MPPLDDTVTDDQDAGEDQDSQQDQDQDQDGSRREPDLFQITGAAEGVLRFLGHDDEAATFADIGQDSGLLEPTADAAIAALESNSLGYLAEPLRRRQTAAREEHERVAAEVAKNDRERRMAELKKQYDEDRAKKEAEDRQAALDAELMAEIEAAEVAASGEPTTTKTDAATALVDQAREAREKWLKGEGTFAEAGAQADAAIKALGELEDSSTEPIDFDAEAYLNTLEKGA